MAPRGAWISSGGEDRRGLADIARQFAKVLCGRGEQDFVAGAAQSAEPEPIELEDAFHVREGHFHLLALVARFLERLGFGQGTDMLATALINVARYFAVRRVGTAPLLQARRSDPGQPCSDHQ